jgi:mitogen-activated protein kinase organizer 1
MLTENKKPVEMIGHKSGVYVVKFSKDGNHVMSGSQDKSIKLWNPYKGSLIKSYDVHSQAVLDIAIAQDNAKFASVGIDKLVYITDSIKGTPIRRYYGHQDRINTVSFNPTETILVSGSYDCSVRIWDLKSQSNEPIQILKDAKDSVSKVIVLNEKIVTASVDGKIRTYDIRMGSLQTDSFDFTINGLDVSPDEKFMIVSGLDNSIKLFENESGQIVKVFKDLHKSQNYTMTVKYTNDLDGILTTSETGDVVLYDLIKPENNKVLKGHEKASCGLDTHPTKNNLIASSGFDGKVLFWDLSKFSTINSTIK